MSSKTSHLERTAHEPRDEGLHEVTLSQIDQVNERIRLFRFTSKSPIKFLPGQWLDTFVPGVSKPGGFTITSSPSSSASSGESKSHRHHYYYIELAVQESPDNPAAAWLWRAREEILGATLHVRVGGSYVFPPEPKSAASGAIKKVVFIAGGVGINPIMSMLSGIAEGAGELNFKGDVDIIYATRMQTENVKGVLFLERIAGLLADGRLRGRMRLFVTGVAPASTDEALKSVYSPADISLRHRRFTTEDLEKSLPLEDRKDSVVYVCGPPAMTDEMVEILTSNDGFHMDPERVLKEKWW